MERFKRTFSFRKKKDNVPEASKPHQWQEDEKKVRDATCSFQVRYLGCIEVFESRGIQVCEEAVKALKTRQNRSVWSRMSLRKKKSKADQGCKGKYQRAILYVSGDALRVVDEISKGLIVDQTIEKVSFCAPDRNHEKGFAYICRDGTTRRWMCHGFLAVKESGERLSHAVGCAFAICLEKKQKREKDAVTVTYNDKGTSFSRMGSFRQATLTERMQDPQSVILPEPVDQAKGSTPAAGGGIDNSVAAVQRPKPSDEMLQRQASFRGFSKLSDNSPFKRQMSLRLNELPSNLARQQQLKHMGHSFPTTNGGVEAIPEVSPSKELDPLSDITSQIEGLSAALHTSNASQQQPQNSHSGGTVTHANNIPAVAAASSHTTTVVTNNVGQSQLPAVQQVNGVQSTTATITSTASSNIPGVEPIRQTNPWQTPPAFRHNSPAESWLESAANKTASSTGGSPVPNLLNMSAAAASTKSQQNSTPLLSSQSRSHTVDATAEWYSQQKAPTLIELQQRNQLASFHSVEGTPPPAPLRKAAAPLPPASSSTQQQQQVLLQQHVVVNPLHKQQQNINFQQQQLLSAALQQQMQPQILTSANTAVQPPPHQLQTQAQLHNQLLLQHQHQAAGQVRPQAAGPNQSNSITNVVNNDPWSIPLGPTSTDPFDAAWATKSPNVKAPQSSSNPFHHVGTGDSVTETFKMQL